MVPLDDIGSASVFSIHVFLDSRSMCARVYADDCVPRMSFSTCNLMHVSRGLLSHTILHLSFTQDT